MSNKYKYLSRQTITILIGVFLFLLSMVVLLQPKVKDGMECLFLLPLSCAVCVIFFSNAIIKTFSNVGMTILYLSIFMRYVVTPLMMSLTNTCSGLSNTKESYLFAILSMVLEIVVVFCTLAYIYRKYEPQNIELSDRRTVNYDISISEIGLAFVFLLLCLVVARGHLQNVFAHISFFGEQNWSDEILFNYDYDVIIALKTMVALGIIVFAYKKYCVKQNVLWCLLALLGAALNVLIYNQSARASILSVAIGTLIILNMLFPMYKKVFNLVVSVVAAPLVFDLVMSGNFWWAEGDFSNVIGTSKGLRILTSSLEAYTNNVSMVGFGIMKYSGAAELVGFQNYIAEFFSNFGFMAWPFLRDIRDSLIDGAPNITTIFRQESGFDSILPSMVQGLWLFGPLGGALFDIAYYVFAVNLIKLLDEKRKTQPNVYMYYCYFSVEWMISLCMLYNLWIFLYGTTGGILTMYLMIKANTIGARVGQMPNGC